MKSEESSNEMWRRVETDKSVVKKALELSKRDLQTAKNLFEDSDYDWCLSIAYNAMLQAGRALMFSKGYRPRGKYKHLAVLEFIKSKFDKEFNEKALYTFNKVRKKRHRAVYEQVRIVSKEEAKNVVTWAADFVKKTAEILKTM